MNYSELFRCALPEAILTVTVLIVLGVQLATERKGRPAKALCSWIAGIGLIAAMPFVPGFGEATSLYGGMLVANPVSALAKLLLLGTGVLVVGISAQSANFKHYGEYLALMLLALIGMMLLVSSDELLMIFIGLELTGLPLYVLTAFRREDAAGAEAGLKYFLFGSTASGFLLFGMSWIYGLCGSTSLQTISAKIAAEGTGHPMLLAALVLLVVGFGFKIAAAPFHFWAPDVYDAAPSPVAGFIASASKIASFVLLTRVIFTGLGAASGEMTNAQWLPGWSVLLAVLAAASIVAGNLAALAQGKLKRLLAYSAIAHSGYALVGFLALGPTGVSSVIFYSVTYALAALGGFVVADQVERITGSNAYSDWGSLFQRSPMHAWCLGIFLLSLAGLPPLPGFFGKFYLFSAAFGLEGQPQTGVTWLICLAFAGSLVSLYYYLVVLRAVFRTPSDAPETATDLCTICRGKIPLLVIAGIVVALGIFPDLLLSHVVNAVRMAF